MWVWIGALLSLLAPTVPFIAICGFAAVLDCLTAWRLARRVKRRHPEIPDEQIHDKFESERMWGLFPKLLVLYGCIVLAHLIDVYIITSGDIPLPNFIAGAFCFYELWSILENESSENGHSWARFLQKIMVNKAERHIDGLRDAIKDMKDDDVPDRQRPRSEHSREESGGRLPTGGHKREDHRAEDSE